MSIGSPCPPPISTRISSLLTRCCLGSGAAAAGSALVRERAGGAAGAPAAHRTRSAPARCAPGRTALGLPALAHAARRGLPGEVPSLTAQPPQPPVPVPCRASPPGKTCRRRTSFLRLRRRADIARIAQGCDTCVASLGWFISLPSNPFQQASCGPLRFGAATCHGAHWQRLLYVTVAAVSTSTGWLQEPGMALHTGKQQPKRTRDRIGVRIGSGGDGSRACSPVAGMSVLRWEIDMTMKA